MTKLFAVMKHVRNMPPFPVSAHTTLGKARAAAYAAALNDDRPDGYQAMYIVSIIRGEPEATRHAYIRSSSIRSDLGTAFTSRDHDLTG